MRKRVIGITGGIGAGKSEVLSLLQTRFGAEVILADEVAHELMEPGQAAYQEIVRQFGTAFLQENGRIDRKAFAALLFQTEGMRERVNAIVHPLVKLEIRRRVKASDAQLVAVEAALLIEEKYGGDICEELWYVYTSREVRIRRLMAGRGYTREKCEQIMASQLSEEEFLANCQRVLRNDGSQEELEQTLNGLVAELMKEGEKT
ncbi:MAG: dephospho-CoA kinase [bacterium]|nr:dephospho-CoA kinase [bacterium]